MTVINILEKDDMFGEVAVLSRLRRTCTAQAIETSYFLTLANQDIQRLQSRIPSLLQDHVIAKYDDENMNMRRQFVRNIPYLENVDFQLVDKLVMLMEQHIYHKGEVILQQDFYSDKIMIILQGSIYMKVRRICPDTGHRSEVNFGKLRQGSCFNVFNSFSRRRQGSLLSYVAAQKNCIIDTIPIQEVLKQTKIHQQLRIQI